MFRIYIVTLCLSLLSGCVLTTSTDSANEVGPEGQLVRAFNPSAESTYQSNQRAAEAKREREFAAKREALKHFFMTTWNQLKIQAANGHGELLDEWLNHSGCRCRKSKKLVNEIRQRQYKKIFRKNKEKGWEHFLWVVDNDIHDRKASLYLTTEQQKQASSSTLLQLLIQHDEETIDGRRVYYNDDKASYTVLKSYTLNPQDHVVDQRIHDALYEYAKRVRNKKLTRLLSKQRKQPKGK